MIKNNLAHLMIEKKIKSISELHRRIKEKEMTISRRTLDKFYNNQNNNISYDTLETLCIILDCELHELLVFDKDESKESEEQEQEEEEKELATTCA